ncbi:MAG: hypothetical protein H6612_13085 [Ignavibacteriales bacterium]|nr:hypothetical protein [Ignavibacteriales bacterium]
MNKDILNKTNILFAQGEKEFLKAKQNINKFYDGKIRTLARRACGFYLDGFLTFSNKDNYGKSFINHLKAIVNDDSVPNSVRDAANNLSIKVNNDELSGNAALNYSETIINFCLKEFTKYKSENE